MLWPRKAVKRQEITTEVSKHEVVFVGSHPNNQFKKTDLPYCQLKTSFFKNTKQNMKHLS